MENVGGLYPRGILFVFYIFVASNLVPSHLGVPSKPTTIPTSIKFRPKIEFPRGSYFHFVFVMESAEVFGL